MQNKKEIGRERSDSKSVFSSRDFRAELIDILAESLLTMLIAKSESEGLRRKRKGINNRGAAS